MKVLVTGPESSGTRWLTDYLTKAGADALHRSQPEGPDWIDLESMLGDFDHVVVVVRGLLANVRSMEMRGCVEDVPAGFVKRRRALGSIGRVLGHGRVTLVTYESLAHRAERLQLLANLGLAESDDHWPWVDENVKHYE